MTNLRFIINIAIVVMGLNVSAHEMQHGFILTNNDSLGSHLVASGHHSRQTEIVGQLAIPSGIELAVYRQRKASSAVNQTYFLFQAQQLDLPKLAAGTILVGHIVESRIGNYEPKNVIVKSATFKIQRVLLNIPNPFFVTPPPQARPLQQQHCCDTGKKTM